MSRVCLSGTYADVPAQIIIDSSYLQSTLSTQFSCTHHVPRDVTTVRGVAHITCSGPVVVPTADGWFHSRLPFKISYLPRGDVVLGADWIAVCQPQLCHGGILRPLQSVVAHLPTGHSWVPVPNTTSHGA
jgi:hypothetical protein